MIPCTDNREDYDTRSEAGEEIIYAALIHMPNTVAPICRELQQLSADAESINCLNPVSSYFKLRSIRRKWQNGQQKFQSQLNSCIQLMGEPVEGASSLDSGWIQGWNSAAGISALTMLYTALSSVSGLLDRKTAYTMAYFSIYLVLVSILVTVMSLIFYNRTKP